MTLRFKTHTPFAFHDLLRPACIAFLLGLPPTVAAQDLSASRVIDLESTIRRTVETDLKVLRHRTEWLVDEARIEEIQTEGGWEFELRGEKEIIQGDRSNFRDSSRGRDPRLIEGELEEDEQSLQFGLRRELLDTNRRQKSDAIVERLKQLDRTEDLLLAANEVALAAGLAYLDVFYGRDLSAMLRTQVAFEEENLRVLRARLEQYEALQLNVLTTEVNLSTLKKRRVDEDMKNLRKLGLLRDIWSNADLQPEALSPPAIADTTALEVAEPDALIQEAWARRPDLGANRAALSTMAGNSGYVDKLPELELGMAGRFRERERDFADTLREDSTFDVLMEFRLRVPLSLQKENALRRKQHQLNVRSRGYQVEARKRSIAGNVRQALEDYRAACQGARIQSLTIKKFEEGERVTRLTAETMPETMKGDPDFEVRKATSSLLEARADLLRADKLRMETLLALMAELGRLAPTPPTIVPALTATQAH